MCHDTMNCSNVRLKAASLIYRRSEKEQADGTKLKQEDAQHMLR